MKRMPRPKLSIRPTATPTGRSTDSPPSLWSRLFGSAPSRGIEREVVRPTAGQAPSNGAEAGQRSRLRPRRSNRRSRPVFTQPTLFAQPPSTSPRTKPASPAASNASHADWPSRVDHPDDPGQPPPVQLKTGPARNAGGKRALYDAMVSELLDKYDIRVRAWRTSMSGIAVLRKDPAGRWLVREIEAPYPKGPMSAAVFLHEVGHHALGVGSLKPRCLEEWAAWDWALREMRRRGVTVTERVEHRVHDALYYAVRKAARRGLRELPPELAPFAQPRRVEAVAARRRRAS